jgi:hypothetical protein
MKAAENDPDRLLPGLTRCQFAGLKKELVCENGVSFASWPEEEAPLPTSAAAMPVQVKRGWGSAEHRAEESTGLFLQAASSYGRIRVPAGACGIHKNELPPPQPLPVPISNGDEVVWLSVDRIHCFVRFSHSRARRAINR